MLVSVNVQMLYTARTPCDLLLQIEAADGGDQRCIDSHLSFNPDNSGRIVAGEDGVGHRRWLSVDASFECHYAAQVQVNRPQTQLDSLEATRLPLLPDGVTKYLMPSRYCHPEDMVDLVTNHFGSLRGGPLVAAMSDWIYQNFTYDIAASTAATTATGSLEMRAGVCRDYAHVLIAMARAAGVPARYVSAYGPNVDPMDIHALVEVYLDGTWHQVDPTGMSTASEIVRIGLGRDAADVSFMTSFGWMEMKKQSIQVSLVQNQP